MDWIIRMAQSKADGIARLLGRQPHEVRNALAQVQKIAPDVQDGKGNELLKQHGFDGAFAKEMHEKYRHLADKIPIPGIGRLIDGYVKRLDGGTGEPLRTPPKISDIDMSKYPRRGK